MKKLRDNTNNIAAALENETAECMRKALQRRHKRVDRLSEKVHVPYGDAKAFELDAVVLTDDCAAVAEVKTVLNESSAVQLQRNVRIIKCVLVPRGILALRAPVRLRAD